ncbi:hypothetical protein [Bergeyella sp. RCAD1439]|uniref:hypothetical protein n=1 Tax=Bergeyella anatis TaxID=3113737 RepID=UPI002E16D67D|nr:hypothetical protein [Bergeyella sp. RCAD1439]
MMKKLLNLIGVLLPLFFLTQTILPAFTVNLTGTAETCPNNGTLSWTTSGATANSSIVYSIYNTSDLSKAVETTTLLTFTGLPTGTYKVVATQTLGTSSNQATSNDFTIADQKPPTMTVTAFSIIGENCGNDGSFHVNVKGGRAPYRYQLIDANNNVISEVQQSLTLYSFTNLPSGTNRYRVIDNCGTGVVESVQISSSVSSFDNLEYYGIGDGCSRVALHMYYPTKNGSFVYANYPLQVKISYTNPTTGTVDTVEGTVRDYSTAQPPMAYIPIFEGVNILPITVTTTDACGRTITQTNNFNYNQTYVGVESFDNENCGTSVYKIYPDIPIYSTYRATQFNFRVEFLNPPSGFDPVSYNEFHGQMKQSHSYTNLPTGTYNVRYINECGVSFDTTIRVRGKGSFSENTVYSIRSDRSCQTDENQQVYYNNIKGGNAWGFRDTKITVAPQAFIDQYGPLPYILPEDRFVIENGKKRTFLLENLPLGEYTFSFGNMCDDTVVTKTITTIKQTPFGTSPSVEYGCTVGNFKFNDNFYYQRYFPEQNAWGTSPTQLDTPGEVSPAFYYNKSFREWYNQPIGRYRIIRDPYSESSETIINNQLKRVYCPTVVLKEFEITNIALTFSNAYAFECANGTYDVALSASGGTAPLTYAIVSSEANDAAITKNNGTNPIFEGLEGGTYFFRVYDKCGNFQTRKLDIAKLGRPGIRMVPVCDTNNLSLAVDGLDYLSYEWTKEGSTEVLSTTNVLNLGEYTADKAGGYNVRLKTNSPTSCINSVIPVKLTENALTAASAGTGQIVNLTYDEAMGTTINLFDYLQGEYDGFGKWTETTTPPSSLLVGSQWRVASAASGTYRFKYSVSGLCGGQESTSEVVINLVKVCYKTPLQIADGDALPSKVGITALNRIEDTGSFDNWPMVRKGGWLALESNKKGMVVNRVAFGADGLPQGIPATDFVSGMMVYDTTNNCLKIYNGTVWSCFSTQTCPE